MAVGQTTVLEVSPSARHRHERHSKYTRLERCERAGECQSAAGRTDAGPITGNKDASVGGPLSVAAYEPARSTPKCRVCFLLPANLYGIAAALLEHLRHCHVGHKSLPLPTALCRCCCASGLRWRVEAGTVVCSAARPPGGGAPGGPLQEVSSGSTGGTGIGQDGEEQTRGEETDCAGVLADSELCAQVGCRGVAQPDLHRMFLFAPMLVTHRHCTTSVDKTGRPPPPSLPRLLPRHSQGGLAAGLVVELANGAMAVILEVS